MTPRFVLACALLCFCVTAVAAAQDPVKVDSAHYTLVSENAQVRVLRFHYGPHEKSVMHSHPNLVVVFLNDGKITFHFPDGKSQDAVGKAGDAQYEAATVHNPENTGDAPIEGILVELKSK